MPIRFRCEHCQQLLGIARRKAGTRVNCPTCRASVLVPGTDQEGLEPLADPGPDIPSVQGEKPVAPAEEPFFERSDFERLFAPTAREQAFEGASVGNMPPPPPFPASNGPGPGERNGGNPVELAPAAVPPPGEWNGSAGYLLTPQRASLLTVMVILLMALAFVGGLLVGRYAL